MSLTLNIPIEVTFVPLVNGPGTTEILDAHIELIRMLKEREKTDYQPPDRLVPFGPTLRFTAIDPTSGTKFSVTVNMTDLNKDGDTYVIDGGINFQAIRLRYRMSRDENGQRGTLGSRKSFKD